MNKLESVCEYMVLIIKDNVGKFDCRILNSSSSSE
jgi:hypothetical protein